MILPEPFANNSTCPAPVLVREDAPITILPLLPVVCKVKLPDVEKFEPTVSSLSVLTLRDENVVAGALLSVSVGPGAVVLDTLALPVVDKVKDAVVVLIGVDKPMFPDPEMRDTDVVPVMVLAVCVIAPDPLALKVTAVPLTAAVTAIDPLAVVDKLRAPPTLEARRLTAVEFTTVAFPLLVLIVRLVAEVVTEPILLVPLPVVSKLIFWADSVTAPCVIVPELAFAVMLAVLLALKVIAPDRTALPPVILIVVLLPVIV